VAYRRNVFERVGEFDEHFDACEDVEFNHRVDAAGLKCWFAPEIAVHYHPRSSIAGLTRQMARYGRGRLRLAAKHPRSLTLPAIAPLIFFLTMATCAALAFAWPWFAAVVVSGFTKYMVVILLATVMLLPKPGRIVAKCWLPLVFVAIHLGFAWGTLREAVRLVLRGASRASLPREGGESSLLQELPSLTREAHPRRAA
jgi:succinoglycan biosynthesis protein ExoA